LAPSRAVEGWPSGDDLGMKWSYQIDRAVTGGALRAGGRAWRRGIGVHAPSRLEWTLDGAWSALRGSVAIDDSVLLLGSRGSVQFRVYVDGHTEPAWSSGRVQGGGSPIEIPALALKGVHQLALEVDMDDKLYVADRADWLRLRLVRAAK
jgi:alpha-galactosidase